MIIVIGWLYVTILIAASEPSLVIGVLSFLFYGALPCGLILYFAGGRVRRERRAFRERQQAASGEPDQAGHPAGDAVAPVGEEMPGLGDGAALAAVNGDDAGSLQATPGQRV